VNAVLRRLASRVLPGAGDIVRPRLRSRFEGGLGAADTADGGLATPSPGAAPAAAALASPPARAEAAPPEATPALLVAAPAVTAAQEAQPAAVRRNAAAKASDRLAPVSDPIAPQPHSTRAGKDPEPAAAADPAAPGFAERAADAPGLPPPPQAEAGNQSEPRPSPLLLPEMRLPEGAAAATAGEAPGRGGELPPDIRISIGRIDVRAGSEPRLTPPRPRARSRPKPMSLEDYLGKGRSRP
jgi:hypothetical protein